MSIVSEERRRFFTDCGICESQTLVEVINVDEEVVFCPMCGTEASTTEVDQDEMSEVDRAETEL